MDRLSLATTVSLFVGGESAASNRGTTSQRIPIVGVPERWAEATPVPPPSEIERRRPLDVVIAQIRGHRRSRRSLVFKRSIDVIGSTIGLVALLPLFALLMIAIKATSRGPAFFVQNRCGLNGRVFRFYKFRTMVEDAEQRKAEVAHLNEMSGPAFKIKRDPRMTKLGALLRKSSLDELPQLWNVLKGDMSLVGPRPPLPEEVELYTTHQAQRLSVMPGITGLWQVSGRSALPNFDEWIELDLRYARTWSLWLDLRILVKTVFVVIAARGAQ
jgi:exopolysaccharide biosynthesis polyprenyl glycosylphosphotransferase